MWLTLAILSYLFFALAAFFDKYILGGALPSPKVYSFYTGLSSLTILFFIPIMILVSSGVTGSFDAILSESLNIISVSNSLAVLLSIITGGVFLLALYAYYRGVLEFEVSRIGPTVGAIVPLFILGLVYLFTFIPFNLGFERQPLGFHKLIALTCLVLGGLVLVLHREKIITIKSLRVSLIASFLFGLALVLTKLVYNFLPFWSGFFWIKIGTFLASFFFLFSKEVRIKAFSREKTLKKKVAFPFIFAKASGAVATVFQNGAISLAPIIFLPIISALSGIQYVFLIVLAILLFFKFPKILKEEISKKVLLQKTIAIWLIVMGLIFLA